MAPVEILPFVPRQPQRVKVNLNALTREGFIRVRSSHFNRPPRVGSRVTIYEPDEEVEGDARVARFNPRTGLVYLEVAWESLHDIELAHVTVLGGDPSAPPASRPRSLRLQVAQ
jgi:hypothetical protein